MAIRMHEGFDDHQNEGIKEGINDVINEAINEALTKNERLVMKSFKEDPDSSIPQIAKSNRRQNC